MLPLRLRGVLLLLVTAATAAVTVIACSSSTDSPADGQAEAGCATCDGGPEDGAAAAVDSGRDAAQPGVEAGPYDDAVNACLVDAGSGSGDGGAPAVCPSTNVIPLAVLPWAAPLSAPGSCAPADYTAIEAYLQGNPQATAAEVETFVKTLPATCHDCVFTDAAAAKWGPAVLSGGKVVTVNIGGCFALVSGSEVVGKAMQRLFDCEGAACAGCADPASTDVCKTKADKGACRCYFGPAQTALSGQPSTLFDACGSFLDSVRVQCATGS